MSHRKPEYDPIPLRRIRPPEEVAEAAVFVASDKASYITKTISPVERPHELYDRRQLAVAGAKSEGRIWSNGRIVEPAGSTSCGCFAGNRVEQFALIW